jgi:hypothetical protein
MKYSLPGHSSCQEVDSAHSSIEKAMANVDVFSPVGLVKLLKQTETDLTEQFSKRTLTSKILHQQLILNYRLVPFSKIASIKFTQVLHQVEFKHTARMKSLLK